MSGRCRISLKPLDSKAFSDSQGKVKEVAGLAVVMEFCIGGFGDNAVCF